MNLKKRPLILVIHGGPHAYSPKDAFLKSRLLWLSMGYNLWVVNYRGSIGYGVDKLNELSGKALDVDINDTLKLFSYWLENFHEDIDDSKLGVYGGSHGGYLTCSVISHPEWIKKFAAAWIWNPVVDMHSSMLSSEIPEWVSSTSLGQMHKWSYNREEVLKMYDSSPLSRVSNVKTPSLFIIGDIDKRVPKSQGMYFWKCLKAQGVETEMHFYPNNGHAVATPECNIDALLKMTNWWNKYF